MSPFSSDAVAYENEFDGDPVAVTAGSNIMACSSRWKAWPRPHPG